MTIYDPLRRLTITLVTTDFVGDIYINMVSLVESGVWSSYGGVGFSVIWSTGGSGTIIKVKLKVN